MRQYFISHNTEDGDLARTLRLELLQRSPDDVVFLSCESDAGPRGGTSWRSWIRRTLTSSDIVLFLASGTSLSPWCSAELGMATLLDTPVISLRVTPDAAVNPVVAHLQTVPLDRPVDELMKLVDDLLGRPDPLVRLPADFEPYPGLAPLTDQQAALLQGRDTECQRILHDFDRFASGSGRYVVVSGPSGSGKSSLVRAGVVPRLVAERWNLVGPTQPRQLAQSGVPPPTDTTRTVLIVDQFEEMVELAPSQREPILAWLRNEAGRGCAVLLVVRSESRTDIGEWIPKPVDEYIPFLGVEDLFAVVRGPARLAQLHVPEPLVERLVRETESGSALPLLAYTLHELWERRDRVEVALTESALDALGGVRGVLAGRAHDALHAVAGGDDETTTEVLALLTRLASPSSNPPTRVPLRLGTVGERERRWLDEFVAVGLVTYRTSFALDDRLDVGLRPSGDHLADVTHEALFGWEPLADAIDQRRAHNTVRLEIERAAAQWTSSGRSDDTLLLAGDRLTFARSHLADTTDTGLRRFVEVSISNDRDRKIRRALTLALAVAALVAVGAAAFAFWQRNSAQAARDEAEAARTVAQSVRLAATAEREIPRQRDVALSDAVLAYTVDANAETEGAIMDALAAPTGPLRYFTGPTADWRTLRVLGDGTAMVASAALHPAIVDLADRRVTELALPGIEVADVHDGPSAGTVLVFGRVPPATWAVALIDVRTGDVRVLQHPSEIRAAAANESGVVFGDVDGVVWFAPIEERSLGTPLEIDRQASPISDITVLGAWVASSSRSGIRALRFDGATWTAAGAVLTVEPGQRAAERVAFRPGQPAPELLAAGSDPTVRRWRIEEDRFVELPTLGTHLGVVNAIAIDPAGTVLFTAGRGGQIERWDLATGAAIGEPLRAHRDDVRRLSASSSERLVSTDDATAVLWDLAPTRVVERSGVVPTSWADESIVAIVEGDGPLAVVTGDDRVLVADGRELAAPPGTRRATWLVDGTIIVETGDRSQLDLPPIDVWTVRAERTERIAAAVDAVDSGRCLTVTASGSTVSFVSAGSCDLDVPARFALERGDVAELALDPDEQRLLVVHADNEIEVRDLGGALLTTFAARQGIVPTSAAWVDDARVAIGHDVGGAVELVDLDSGQGDEITVHDDAVWWLVVDHERGRLVTGGQDGLVIRTDLERGVAVGEPLTAERRSQENDPNVVVRGVRLTADGALIVLQANRLVTWELDPERLVERACADAGRAPTAADLERVGADPERPPCRAPQ